MMAQRTHASRWLTVLSLMASALPMACGEIEDEGTADSGSTSSTAPSGKSSSDAMTAGTGTADAASGPEAGPHTPMGPVSVLELGSETLSDEGVDVDLWVPEGTESFALVVDGSSLPDELMIAERVTNPSGDVLFDFENDISINRTDATFGYYTLLIPNNPEVEPEAGKWVVKMRSGSERLSADMTFVTKNEPNVDSVLDLKLYFVGLEGLGAEEAEADEGFQGILTEVGKIYEEIGLSIGEVSYADIEGDDADRLGVIDSDAELADLFSLSPTESSRSLNIFFINDIALGDEGLSVLGLAGGVPGPPTLQGTSRSGVAVNMGSFLDAVMEGDADKVKTASEELEIIISHETGHYLGLFHTVERNGVNLDGEILGEDPLSDTTTCPDSADANEDNLLSPAECEGEGANNLMFWSPANDARSLSSQQGEILLRNPAVR